MTPGDTPHKDASEAEVEAYAFIAGAKDAVARVIGELRAKAEAERVEWRKEMTALQQRVTDLEEAATR